MDRLIPTTEVAFASPGVLPFLLRLMGWGCSHENYTVPMRLSGEIELTVSCLQCAARLHYDWDRMALTNRLSKPARMLAPRAGATVINGPGRALSQGSGLREVA